MKVPLPLAKNVLGPLGLTAAMSAIGYMVIDTWFWC